MGIAPALEWAERGAGSAVSGPCGCCLPGDPGRSLTGGARPHRAFPQVPAGTGAGLLPFGTWATGACTTDECERRVCLMEWVTWEQVGVDRMACAWLITKYLDPAAEFLFVPAGHKPLPEEAEPFD